MSLWPVHGGIILTGLAGMARARCRGGSCAKMFRHTSLFHVLGINAGSTLHSLFVLVEHLRCHDGHRRHPFEAAEVLVIRSAAGAPGVRRSDHLHSLRNRHWSRSQVVATLQTGQGKRDPNQQDDVMYSSGSNPGMRKALHAMS